MNPKAMLFFRTTLYVVILQGSVIIRQPKRKAEGKHCEELSPLDSADQASASSMPAALQGLEVLHVDIIQEQFWLGHPEILR